MPATAQEIQEALKLLDVNNKDHWTTDGLPTIAVVADLVGEKNLRRGDITAAAPAFTRENPSLVIEPIASAPAGTDPATQDPSSQDSQSGGEEEEEEQDDEDSLNQPQPPVEEEEIGEEAELAELQAKVEEAEAEMATQQAAMEKAQGALHKAQALRDQLIHKISLRTDPHQNQRDIMQFINSQAAQRQARADQFRAAQAAMAGIRSPLDASMQRKTGYGKNRPAARPLPNRE